MLFHKAGYVGYRAADLERLKHRIPTYPLANNYVAVPDDERTLYLLHQAGLPTPDLMSRYDWPHGPSEKWKDSSEQRQVSNFLVKNRRSFLLSEPRTGKTISTLWAIDWMQTYGLPGAKALILAPKSTLEDVWLKEVNTHLAGRRSAVAISGYKKQRCKALAQDVDIYIANFEAIKIGVRIVRDKFHKLVLSFDPNSFGEDLFNRSDIDIIVIDEMTSFKAAKTAKGWILKRFIKDKTVLWAITGTPTPDSPMDAYNMAKLVVPNFKLLKSEYQKETMQQVSTHVWHAKPGAEVHAANILRPNIRFAYGDVFDPDEQLHRGVRCAISDRQLADIRELRREHLIQLQDGKLTAANEGVARSKYLQIANGGYYYTGMHTNGPGDTNGPTRLHTYNMMSKVEAVQSILSARGKALIFIPFTFCAPLLLDGLRWLTKQGMYNYEYISAKMTPVRRAAAFDRFRADPHTKFVLADPRIMAHGLNLSEADTIIWFGAVQRSETWQQANRRVVKPGGKSVVYSLYATDLERDCFQALRGKQRFQGLVLKELERMKDEPSPVDIAKSFIEIED